MTSLNKWSASGLNGTYWNSFLTWGPHQLFKHQNETLGVLAPPTHYFLFLGFLRPLRFIAVPSGSWVVPIPHIYVPLPIGQAKSDSRSALIVQRSASSGLNLHPQIKHWVALLKSIYLCLFMLFDVSLCLSMFTFISMFFEPLHFWHTTQEFLFPPADAWSNLKVCMCQQPQSDVIYIWKHG